MSDFNDYTRVNKFEKRRKNTKSLSIFLVLGSILLIALLGIIIFGGDDKADQPAETTQSEKAGKEPKQDEGNAEETASDEDEQSTSAENDTEDDNSTTESTASNETTNSEENNNNGEVEAEQVEPSDDNVDKAYTKDWQPIGTEQTGQHTVNYNDGSQDRIEMRKAAASATGLDADSLTLWWTERNGDQKVIATVSNPENTDVYRAYLTWIDDQGWKPTKVEELKENDQEWRFE